MIIQNRSARGYWIRVGTNADDSQNVSTLVAPGEMVEVTDARGAAMIKAGTHRHRGAVVAQEIVEVKGATPEPMPAAKVPGLSGLPEETAIELVGRCDISSLDKLTEGETRPAVLAAAKARRSPAPPPPPEGWSPKGRK